MARPSSAPWPADPDSRPAAPRVRRIGKKRRTRSRYRFRRRHTPHYYLVLTSISAAIGVCVVDAVALVTQSVDLAGAAFVVTVAANIVLFTTFFWGFYMAMSGNIPLSRLKYFVPHAMVGLLTPLLYTLNICADLETLGQPLGGLSLACSVASLGLIGVQFAIGKAVVKPDPLRIMRKSAM
jgi:hypothetical protein